VRTLHERALVETVLRVGAPWKEELKLLLGRVKAERYPRWFVDFVVQKQRPLDLFDAYVIGSVLARYRFGELRFLRLDVGASPSADRERVANQAKLDAGLPSGVEAVISPSSRGDGHLSWRDHTAVLEIGTTASSRTLEHLEFGGEALARWPYESGQIVVALKTENWKHWFSTEMYDEPTSKPGACPYCAGSGEAYDPGTGEGPICPACGGSGRDTQKEEDPDATAESEET
jgi:hypothetical protein